MDDEVVWMRIRSTTSFKVRSSSDFYYIPVLRSQLEQRLAEAGHVWQLEKNGTGSLYREIVGATDGLIVGGHGLDFQSLLEAVEQPLEQIRFQMESVLSDDQIARFKKLVEFGNFQKIFELLQVSNTDTAAEMISAFLWELLSTIVDSAELSTKLVNLDDTNLTMHKALNESTAWELTNVILTQICVLNLDLLRKVKRLQDLEDKITEAYGVLQSEIAALSVIDQQPEVVEAVAWLYDLNNENCFWWLARDYISVNEISEEDSDKVFDELLMPALAAIEKLKAIGSEVDTRHSALSTMAKDRVFSQTELIKDRTSDLGRVISSLEFYDDLPLPIEPYERFVAEGKKVEDETVISFEDYLAASELRADPRWKDAETVHNRFYNLDFDTNKLLNREVGLSQTTLDAIREAEICADKLTELLGLGNENEATQTDEPEDEHFNLKDEDLLEPDTNKEIIIVDEVRLKKIYGQICVIAATHDIFNSNRPNFCTTNSLLDLVIRMGGLSEAEKPAYRERLADMMYADAYDMRGQDWQKVKAKRIARNTTNLWIVSDNSASKMKLRWYKPTLAAKVILAERAGLDISLNGNTGDLLVSNESLLQAYGINIIDLEVAIKSRKATEYKPHFKKKKAKK
jgi:hypothetical protein